MQLNKIAIATISFVRNREEATLLRQSLGQLAALGIPVFVTDGGSPDDFISFLRGLRNFEVFAAQGLWPQAKKSIFEAANAGAEWILYTEPDKLHFFTMHLRRMLAEAELNNKTGVVLASRSEEGYATFPPFQQLTENTINKCCCEITGLAADYCYGPFLFNNRLLSLLGELPENCGWGWRPFLFAAAHRAGFNNSSFTGEFTCPPEQQTDDAAERVYRMKQLTQNIEGLLLATSIRV